MLKNNNCGQTIMLFMYKFAGAISCMQHTILGRMFYQGKLANGIKVDHNLLNDDFSIRVYRSFNEIFHKCINIAINVFYVHPIMLALYA